MTRRPDNKGRSRGEARHVRLYHALMNTEAWASLDCVSRCAYVEIARRYGGPGTNNGRIPYSLREMAKALRVSKATAGRALQRLQHRGFVVMTKRGAFTIKSKEATEWRLTEYPCDVTGALPMRAYQAWKKQNTVSPRNPDGPSGETTRVST